MSKLNWKKVIGWGVAIALICGVVGYNAYKQNQRATTDKTKIYAILPLSGNVADMGQKIKSYMELWQQHNPNAPFEIVYLDDESKPDKAVSVFQQMTLFEKQPVVVSAVSFISRVLIPMVEEKGGFLFGLTTVEGDIMKLKTGFQRMAAGVTEAQWLLDYATKRYKKITIMNMENDFGIAEKDLFVKKFPKDGREIVQVIGIQPSQIDVRIEAYKAISKPSDAIFISGTVTLAYLNVIKELKAQGYKGDIIADLAFSNPYTYTEIGENANDVITLTTPLDTTKFDKQTNNKLLQSLQEKDIPLYFLPIQVFDTLDLVKYTIDNNLPFTQKTYTDIGVWKGVSGDVIFTGNGDASVSSYRLARVKNGKPVPVE